MSYTVSMVLTGRLADSGKGVPAEPLPGRYMTVDDANIAGNAEIERRKLAPGIITYRVYEDAGQEVDENGMGLS